MSKLIEYLNQSPTVFFILKKTKTWELEYVTENVVNIYGHKAKRFLEKEISHEDFIHKDDLQNFINEAKQVSRCQSNEFVYKPYRIVRGNDIVWVNHITKIIRDDKGNPSYYFGYLTDITHMENTKRNLEEYISIVNENVLISRTDTKGVINHVSDAYCKFTGYLKEELIGKTHSLLKHPDNSKETFSALWNTIKKGNPWKGEIKNIKKDGTVFWVENSINADLDEEGNIIGYTSIYYDITDKKEISELLITDFLTKIYNRRHFNTVFDLELKRSIRHKKSFVLMILDIDFFKQYNDTYGHDAGDKVLSTVALALKNTLKRSEDFVFRLGGEEFGIITSSIDKEGLFILARKLRQSIHNLQIEHSQSNTDKYLTISIGMKLINYDSALCQNDIYKLADEALYKAKEGGRNKAILCTKDSLNEEI